MLRTTLVCLSLVLPAAAHAERPTWGGAGYATQGWALGDISGIGEDLGVDAPPGFGMVLGGGGFALLGGVGVLGGQGYGLVGLDGAGVASSTSFTGFGGGFNAGIAVVNGERALIFPYVGAVGHGGTVVVANGTDPAAVGGQDLAPGQRQAFEGGGWALDLGASVFHLPWGKDGGGTAVGGSMGVWVPVGAGSWSVQGGREVPGLQGTPAGLYFRMNVGGGGALRG